MTAMSLSFLRRYHGMAMISLASKTAQPNATPPLPPRVPLETDRLHPNNPVISIDALPSTTWQRQLPNRVNCPNPALAWPLLFSMCSDSTLTILSAFPPSSSSTLSRLLT